MCVKKINGSFSKTLYFKKSHSQEVKFGFERNKSEQIILDLNQGNKFLLKNLLLQKIEISAVDDFPVISPVHCVHQ